jgi:hypothetical protein
MRRTLPPFRSLIEEQPLCNQNRAIMQGVTRHVFTLRADMARLRRFIDSYLNFVDDDMPPPFYFQPAAPFVMFELLYYPYLTVASRNLVSYPQREMSFSIPIECYAIEDGVLVFKQYAVCVPFLYVDEELSVISGRNLFGLPKVALKFNDLIDQVRPDFPTQIGRLTLRVPSPIGDVYAPFIEVYRDPPRYISARQTPANLINALPDAIRGYTAFAADAWEALARPPIRGYDNQRDLRSMLGMLRAGADMLSAGFPIFPFMRQAPQFAESSADEQLGPLFSDIISLKQARDAEHPELVSYQSLVRSTMYLDRLNDGGVLFGPLASDPSSDITIKIHNLQGQPLVESLGLVTENTTAVGGSGQSAAAGGRSDTSRDAGPMVSTLKPVLPYWLNVDLAYAMGTTLYWRGRNTQWSSTNDPGPPGGRNRYLTFGSGAMEEEASLLVSPESVIWVFQLPLDTDNDGPWRLNRLISEYLRSDCYVFQLAAGVGETSIWMFVRNMDNTSEGKGPDVEQEVEFAAMVQWFEKKDGRACGPALGAAMMPLYVLTDNQTAVFTESEVYGRPTVQADIDFEGDNWTSGNVAAVMNAETLLLPELYAGGAPANRRIVRLEATFPSGLPKTALPKDDYPEVLKFPTVALKQIEDCRLPDRVDFQAIVFRLLRIQPYSPQTLQAISPALPPTQLFDKSLWSVNIYRYESLPLVRKMGLKAAYQKPSKYTTVDVIKPCEVWALGASIEELGAVNLAWRQGDSPWMTYDNPLAKLEKLEPGVTEAAQALPTKFVGALNGLAVASIMLRGGVTSILRGDTIRSNLEESREEGGR